MRPTTKVAPNRVATLALGGLAGAVLGAAAVDLQPAGAVVVGCYVAAALAGYSALWSP